MGIAQPTSEPLDLDIRPARMTDIYPVLALHRIAFADKFRAAFGPQGSDRGIEALAEAWRRQGSGALRGMVVALAGEQVVGTITLRTWEMGGDDTLAAELAFRRVLGSWGALRSMFALSLLDHQIARDEGYITDVAVDEAFRRRGVAKAMLAYVEEEAAIRRKRVVTLYVSSSNAGAVRLYATQGFERLRVRRSLMTALVLQRWGWLLMQKRLV